VKRFAPLPLLLAWACAVVWLLAHGLAADVLVRPASMGSSTAQVARHEFRGLHYLQRDHRYGTIEIRARVATWPRRGVTARLEHPVLTLTDDSGTLTVRADLAEVDVRHRDIKLTGTVEVRTSTAQVLATSSLRYRQRGMTLATFDKVTLRRDGYTTTGIGMLADLRLGRLRLIGRDGAVASFDDDPLCRAVHRWVSTYNALLDELLRAPTLRVARTDRWAPGAPG